jgi:hypothetical protein
MAFFTDQNVLKLKLSQKSVQNMYKRAHQN